MTNIWTDPGSDVLPALPRDHEGPVFAEPWQAQAFAMAVRLHETRAGLCSSEPTCASGTQRRGVGNQR